MQRLLARRRRVDLLDRGLRPQHPREIVERGPLVIDGEHAERHAARTPARNFGTSMRTVVPSPGVRLDLQSVLRAERRLQAGVDIGEADARAATRERRRGLVGAHARAAVLDRQLDVGVEVGAEDLDPAGTERGLDPVAHGVLHQRLHREHGHDRGQHLGRDAHPHVQPVPEARLL